MFCPNCGTQVSDGSAFCGNCGVRLGGAAPQPQQPAYQQPRQTQKVKKKLSIGKIALIAAAALAGVIVIAMALQGAFIPKGLNGAKLSPQRLYEDDGVTIDVTGLTYDKDLYWGYGVGLKITNRYDSTIVVNCEDLTIYVNDRNSSCAGSGKIDPDETVTDRCFYFSDYGKGFGKIKTITFTLEIGAMEGDEMVDKYTAGTYTLKTNYAD